MEFLQSPDKYPALVTGYGGGKTLAFCLKGLAQGCVTAHARAMFKRPEV